LYIHSLFARRSNGSYGPLVEETQQFGLQSKGHIANLIQKQSALVCFLATANQGQFQFGANWLKEESAMISKMVASLVAKTTAKLEPAI
jgi:hypothetical protein